MTEIKSWNVIQKMCLNTRMCLRKYPYNLLINNIYAIYLVNLFMQLQVNLKNTNLYTLNLRVLSSANLTDP